MSDIINIKDFYDQEKRIVVLETTNIHIHETLNRLEHIMQELRTESRSHFRWLMGFMFGLYATVIGVLSTIIFKIA